LIERVAAVATGGQFLWSNQQLVHLIPAGMREPWATIHTKRPEHVQLTLSGPKNAIGFGRVAGLGFDRDLDATHRDRDHVRIRFRSTEDLALGDLDAFLREHFRAVSGSQSS
jgi:hypothetical protein